MTQIMPGGEPFFLKGGPAGCLMTHGFTASPQEVSWMGYELNKLGYTVLSVRLAGHATSLADLARMRWQDWLHSVEDGYHQLAGHCKEIVPIGISLGGALSLKLAAHNPVRAVIGISTPYRLNLPAPALLKAASLIVPYKRKGPPDWNREGALEERVHYEAYPLRAIAETALVLDDLRPELSSIRCPVLLMHSNRDDFVTPDNMDYLYTSLGSTVKKKRSFERSNHILTCDVDREEVLAAAVEFLQELSTKQEQ